MKNFMNKVNAFFYDQKGAETAEWALIVGILVVIAVAVYGGGAGGTLGTALKSAITALSNAIAG